MPRQLHNASALPSESPGARRRRLRPLRWIMILISATLIGLGSMSLLEARYVGSSTLNGGADVLLEGREALRMGLGLVIFGLFPMGVWWPTARSAAWWTATTLVMGIICMLWH